MNIRRFRTSLSALALALALVPYMTPLAYAQDAASLRARHAVLRTRLLDNQFKRPLHLESTESNGSLKGDIYAQINKPYATIAKALQGTDHWCDILILHLNVKSCRASTSNGGQVLNMHIGRKFDQTLDDTYAFDFLYKTLKVQTGFLQVGLNSAQGPMGTSDYRVLLEVVQLDAQRSFLHLSYSYRYGMMANLAMRSYLATGGRHKLGFATVGRKADGQPKYLGGVRGVVERNTMRYYLAIESYLGAPNASAQQLEKRLNDWHTGVESYPLQLHEMERTAYLEMKHKEIARQQPPITLRTAAR